MKERHLMALAEAKRSRDLWREIAQSCEEHLDNYGIAEIEISFWPIRSSDSGKSLEGTMVSISSLLFAANAAAIDCQEFLDSAGIGS